MTCRQSWSVVCLSIVALPSAYRFTAARQLDRRKLFLVVLLEGGGQVLGHLWVVVRKRFDVWDEVVSLQPVQILVGSIGLPSTTFWSCNSVNV